MDYRAANEAERNTNTPVSYSDKYDYSVKIEGFSEKTNKTISECARRVAKSGSGDGNEHMYLINVDNGKEAYYEKGISGEVGGDAFWRFLENNRGVNYAFVHNHNTDGYFSEMDMRTLLREEQICAMIAVRNDAIIYIAEKGEKLPKTGYFDEMFADELNQLSLKIKAGEITEAERSIKREEIIVDGLIKRYTKAGKLVEINGQK